MYLSIYLYLPSIYSIYLSICPSVNLTIYLYTCICLLIYLCNLSVYLSTCIYVIYLSTYLSLLTIIYLVTYIYIYLYFYLTILHNIFIIIILYRYLSIFCLSIDINGFVFTQTCENVTNYYILTVTKATHTCRF